MSTIPVREDITYSESARGVVVSHSRAIAELKHHGVYDPADQLEALTEARVSDGRYSASRLLEWLGY